MKRVDFKCSSEMAATIIKLLGDKDDDYPLISVYGKYNVIRPLLESLIIAGLKIDESIELETIDISGYDKEFVLYASNAGVSVEKEFKYGKYLYGSGSVSFVHEDCNSKLLSYVESYVVYEFGFVGAKENVKDNAIKKEIKKDIAKDSPKETNKADKADKVDKKDSNDIHIKVTHDNVKKKSNVFDEMERYLEHINDLFDEMDRFRKLFNW